MTTPLNYFDALLKAVQPGDLLLDIGGNVGGHTGLILEHSQGAHVHVFEPLAPCFHQILETYGRHPRVSVYNLGMSCQVERVENLLVHEAWTLGPAGRFPRGENAYCRDTLGLKEPFGVTFTTVDTHWRAVKAAYARLAFMKIDTDGYEARVLQGATHTLTGERPTILLEIGYCIADVDGPEAPMRMLDLIYGYQYRLHDLETGTPWTHTEALQVYPWHTTQDVVMIPQEVEYP